MKLRIPTRRHPPAEEEEGEEEHAEQQLLAAQRLALLHPEAERRVAAVGPVVRLQVREVVYLLRPLTPVPLSFLQSDLRSTKARSVKSKRSSTVRGNSSSALRASSQRRIMIGKVFFRPHSAARANT